MALDHVAPPDDAPERLPADPATDEAAATYDKRWWTLAVLCLSLLIVFVGNSSLNVTIPTLSRVLGASTAQLQWVIAAYSLVFAGLLFSTGALGDRFGRKGALQLGLGIYLTACILATMSDAMWQLIGCRAVMGIGAAFIMPSTLSILVNVFPPEERTKAIAIWASVTGAAGAIGPVASGWLLGHFWYGSVFLVNVPILLTALIAGWFLVPKSKDPQEAQLDPLGALLSIVGIVALVYGLIQAPEDGWASPATLLAFAVAAIILGLFVLWELHVDEPMLDIRYFKNPAFSAGTGGMILIFLSMYGVMFMMTQYFQLIHGYSPLGTALRLLPMAPIMIIVSPLTPRLIARFGANRVVAVGMCSIAGGLLMFRVLTPTTSYWYMFIALIPLVSGMALSMSPMTASIMSAVPPRRAGAGSAMNDASRELGAALGIALMGSLAASAYTNNLSKATAHLPASIQAQANKSLADALSAADKLGGAAGHALTAAAQHAFIDGIQLAVTGSALLAVFAAVVTFFKLPSHPEHTEAGVEVAETPIEAAELALELGIAGVEPAFADGD
jgi:EmrB/QacA subfamily drug resistance transporter